MGYKKIPTMQKVKTVLRAWCSDSSISPEKDGAIPDCFQLELEDGRVIEMRGTAVEPGDTVMDVSGYWVLVPWPEAGAQPH